ncbi:AcrR family transcriptional regulator [Catenulispora sp. EB89]|uniref:TetR/AcrR family transcriptional regulator n=1 Tax=Catenulispora sp. EB89 TaxID=3156257 RepID=UPI0035143D21
MATEKTDLRREAGQRTRDGLMSAALELLADRGQEGVTLREITDKAGANVAAVSYHFGSLRALCDSAIEHALESYLDEQIRAISALGPASTIDELAEAFALPMVRAIAAGGRDRDVMRTVARVAIDPPESWERLTAKFELSRRDAMRVLEANLPGVSGEDLVFRIRCAAGILNWLALAPIGAELATQPVEEIARKLLPVVAGAFHGYSSMS